MFNLNNIKKKKCGFCVFGDCTIYFDNFFLSFSKKCYLDGKFYSKEILYLI